MAQRGQREGLDVVGGDVVAAGQPGPGAGGGQQGGRTARGDAEGEGRRFTGGAADVDDVPGDLRGDGHLGDAVAGGFEFGGAGDRAQARGVEVARVEAGGVPGQDADLVLAGGQGHGELEEEAVQLGFRQGVRALVLDRVHGGGDEERLRQDARRAVDGDLALLHGFEEGGLGLGRGPVDLVREEQVGEDRAVLEGELGGAGVVDERAGDIAGHQVRGELDALGVEGERGGEGPYEEGLGDAGHAFEEDVAAAQQGDDETGDGRVLADDGLSDLGADRFQGGAGAVRGGRHEVRTSLSRASRWSASATSAASSSGVVPKRRAVRSR